MTFAGFVGFRVAIKSHIQSDGPERNQREPNLFMPIASKRSANEHTPFFRTNNAATFLNGAEMSETRNVSVDFQKIKIERLLDLLRRATANGTHQEVANAIATDWDPPFFVDENGKIEVVLTAIPAEAGIEAPLERAVRLARGTQAPPTHPVGFAAATERRVAHRRNYGRTDALEPEQLRRVIIGDRRAAPNAEREKPGVSGRAGHPDDRSGNLPSSAPRATRIDLEVLWAKHRTGNDANARMSKENFMAAVTEALNAAGQQSLNKVLVDREAVDVAARLLEKSGDVDTLTVASDLRAALIAAGQVTETAPPSRAGCGIGEPVPAAPENTHETVRKYPAAPEPAFTIPRAAQVSATCAIDVPAITGTGRISDETIVAEPFSITDGFGNHWQCIKGAGFQNCGLQVVRPGKVQCWCDTEADKLNARVAPAPAAPDSRERAQNAACKLPLSAEKINKFRLHAISLACHTNYKETNLANKAEINGVCDQALRAIELERENAELKAQLKTAYGYGNDKGAPPWMTGIYNSAMAACADIPGFSGHDYTPEEAYAEALDFAKQLERELTAAQKDAERHLFAMRHVSYYSMNSRFIVDCEHESMPGSGASLDYELKIDAALAAERGRG